MVLPLRERAVAVGASEDAVDLGSSFVDIVTRADDRRAGEPREEEEDDSLAWNFKKTWPFASGRSFVSVRRDEDTAWTGS